MKQLLLFPDPRPLVERLGLNFFREAPQGPGVYLMRDSGETVLYVGKAKNLRKRLSHYRVANPDRLARRHLRLLRAVERIDLELCPDEEAALARESELLRGLRPRFNRAGTWSSAPRFVAWRVAASQIEFAITTACEPGWFYPPQRGRGTPILLASLLRLLWCAVHPERGPAQLPAGWLRGTFASTAIALKSLEADELLARLTSLFTGKVDSFVEWIEFCAKSAHPFEVAYRQQEVETLRQFFGSKPATAFVNTPSLSEPQGSVS